MKTKLGLVAAALAALGVAPLANAADLDDRYDYDRSAYSDRAYDSDVYEERETVVVRRRPVRVIEDYDYDEPDVVYYGAPRYPYAYGAYPYRHGFGYYGRRHHRHGHSIHVRHRW